METGTVSRVVVSEFITLDGVFQDPGGVGEIDGGGWAFRVDRGSEGERFKLDEVRAAGALLLGRITYEGFAKAWPTMPRDEAGFADRMDSLPKHVVSTTLHHTGWNNSTVIRGDLAEAVGRLREEVDGDILVNGSGQLVRALLEHDLVDELRLMLFPIVLGTGKRLFAESGKPATLRTGTPIRSGDCVILTYERPRP